MLRNTTILATCMLEVFTFTGCDRSALTSSKEADVENGLLPATIIDGEPGFRLTDRMEHYGVPGLSVAVIEDAEIRWVNHYGVTDVRDPVPVDNSTMFNVGSMSKAVSSVVVLSLAGDGLIELDAPVNDQLRTWRLPDNELSRQAAVTPLRLMNHSGGTVFSPGVSYPAEQLPSLAQLLEGLPPSRTGPIRIDRVPGTTFQYSNPGYTVLRKLVEDVTGKPFADVASERVFGPLRMSMSTFEAPLPPALLEHASMGHRSDGSVDAEVRRWCGHVAAGGLWTTAADYATFVVELQRALRGDSDLLLSRELAERMVAPHDAAGYGLGVFLREALGERRYVGHIGDGPGFVGGFTTDTVGQYGVVVLTNGRDGISLVREVRRSVAKAYGWPDSLPPALVVVELDDDVAEKTAGRYRFGFDRAITVTRSDGLLWLELPGAVPMRLYAVDDTTLVCRERSGRITLDRAPSGLATRLTSDLSDEIGRPAAAPLSMPRMADGERTPLELLLEDRVEEATALYRDLLDADPSATAVAESRLNRLGYRYLSLGRAEDAVAVFRLYAALYPESSNAHDSLGEGLMTAGDLDAAVASYRRSLELDPGNGNAKAMIAKIEASR